MFCVSETEASGVVLLPEQKAKMRASRLQRAYLEVLTRCDEWNRILRIAENTRPLSQRLVPSGGNVRAVLEVIAGTANKLGLAPGDRVTHPIFSGR